MSASGISKQVYAERLAASLGLTVRSLAPEKVRRRWRVCVEVLRDGSVIDGVVGEDINHDWAARSAWAEAFSALRAMTREVLPEPARRAAVVAYFAREERLRRAAAVDDARSALARAEAAYAGAVAADVAALDDLSRYRASLDVRACAVLDALAGETARVTYPGTMLGALPTRDFTQPKGTHDD